MAQAAGLVLEISFSLTKNSIKLLQKTPVEHFFLSDILKVVRPVVQTEAFNKIN